MREKEPFGADDLAELDERLFARASALVPMREIAAGKTDPAVLGVRHDVDNFIEPAVALAEWESARGYRSTYFILHTAPYWQQKDELQAALERIAECGHEIGFHVNALTEAIQTGRDPLAIVEDAVGELRGYGYEVTGVVAHGDSACYRHNFVNDEIFLESPRPTYGAATRTVGGVPLRPVSRTMFGFEYDPNKLPRSEYLSDSGGEWSQPFDSVADGFPYDGQLHVLHHPDWWAQAFVRAAA